MLEFLSCGIEDSDPVLVFVSKLFAMDKTALPQHQTRYVGGLAQGKKGRERSGERWTQLVEGGSEKKVISVL